MKVKLLISLFIVLFLAGCPMDYGHGFFMFNNSDKTIVAWYANVVSTYPSTSLPEDDPSARFRTIPSGEEESVFSIGMRVDDWEKDHMHTFYVFDPDTLEKYTWEEVRDGHKILKRYDLETHDLKEHDYMITYP